MIFTSDQTYRPSAAHELAHENKRSDPSYFEDLAE
jgi:hypothetical protein